MEVGEILQHHFPLKEVPMKAIHIAIIGGKLQGVEACYLARKAGWRITLFDRNPACPASQMADQFYPVDVTADDITALVQGCDALDLCVRC